jgi:hypothetical protein
MNTARLQEATKSNVTANAMMLYFAIRERHTESFNVRVLKNDLLRAGIAVNDKDLYKVLEIFQSEKLGSIIYAKKGGDDVFKWGYNINQFNKSLFPETVTGPILKLSPPDRLEAIADAVKGFTPMKRPVGRPKGSTKKTHVLKTESAVKRGPGRPKGSKNKQEASPTLSMNKRFLAIPLKNNRDIKIEIPFNINKDEVALVNLALTEIVT